MTYPEVWIRIGELDHVAARQARDVLRRAASIRGASIVVDLAALDDRHDLSMFALLAETTRHLAATAGRLTALAASPRLATGLRACGVDVLGAGSAPLRSPGTVTIDIGMLPASRGHAS